jgi:hypothetical protein
MDQRTSFSATVTRLVIITTIIRLLIAWIVPLGNDEVYYFTYSLQPDWNHFDHPPLVGLFIRLFTFDHHWVNELTMRLTSVLSAAVCTLLIAKCGKLLKNEKAGLIAALLYTGSIYTSIIAGLFILPDSPQLVFWIACLYIMLKLIREPDKTRINKLLLLFGLLAGLACMSKIHGLFLWFSFGCYVFFYDRKWLTNPFLYIAVLITLCIIAPVIWWNINNDFITWRFHSERVEVGNRSIDFLSFLATLGGQLFYNNPVNVILAFISIIALIKQPGYIQKKDARILCWSSLPLIFLTTAISLFRQTLPHWSGPGFIALILLSAVFIEYQLNQNVTRYKKWLRTSLGFMIGLVLLGTVAILYYPGTISDRQAPKTGKGDVTLDMYGWREFSKEFAEIRQKDIEKGLMKKETPLLVHKWFPAGHLLFYITYPQQMKIIGEGTLKDLHKFVWLNEEQGYLSPGEDAYYISPSNYFKDPEEIYKDKFRSITLAATIPQKRGGKIARYWYIYHLKGALQETGARLNSKD